MDMTVPANVEVMLKLVPYLAALGFFVWLFIANVLTGGPLD